MLTELAHFLDHVAMAINETSRGCVHTSISSVGGAEVDPARL